MPAEPREAAACILVRGEAHPEVLLAKRNPTLRFMAGHHVFPGGRIDRAEEVRCVINAPNEEYARAVQAAVREVFEETGLLCVRGDLPSAELLRGARHDLLDEKLPFSNFLAQHGLTVDANDFEPAGDWLTPTFVPIRFSTRYFLHRLNASQHEELIEGEIVALDWLTPAEARRQWHAGQLKIPTPVAYTLRQLAAADLSTATGYLRRGTERAPGEHNWFELRRGITLVPVRSATVPPATHTNCIIVGEELLYVIDPGACDEGELQHLCKQIDHLLELGGRVEAVLLSHSHRDHTDAAEAMRDRYGAPLLAHPATEQQLSFKVDRYLQDGDVLESGPNGQWQLECVHTPGHDPGHLCFLEKSTRTLLAGDMVANPGTILVSRLFAGDMGQFVHSLQRLLELDCTLIVPSHGQAASKPREFVQKHLDHRLWREEKIKQAHAAGADDFETLLARAYDDAKPEALAWARHSLDAHLAKLGIDMPVNLRVAL